MAREGRDAYIGRCICLVARVAWRAYRVIYTGRVLVYSYAVGNMYVAVMYGHVESGWQSTMHSFVAWG